MSQTFRALSWALLALFLVSVVQGENVEWKRYQREYDRRLADKLADPEQKREALRQPLVVQQVWIPEINRVDRCMTCHAGIENPAMAGEPQPFSPHPGDFLKKHPVSKFGCTLCHGGQGHATTVEDAHGNVEHWQEPLLPTRYVELSCGKCHPEGPVPEAPTLTRGRQLFASLPCSACHMINGVGGTTGPDLTDFGLKGTFQLYDNWMEFHFPTEGLRITVEPPLRRLNMFAAWTVDHFLDPQKVMAGDPLNGTTPSAMPKLVNNEDDAQALTTLVLSLRDEHMPSDFVAKPAVPTAALAPAPSAALPAPEPMKGDPAKGKATYLQFCATCHGDAGKGDGPAAAALNPHPRNHTDAKYMSTRDDATLFKVIKEGGSSVGRSALMPAWGAAVQDPDIWNLVAYLRQLCRCRFRKP